MNVEEAKKKMFKMKKLMETHMKKKTFLRERKKENNNIDQHLTSNLIIIKTKQNKKQGTKRGIKLT